MSASRDPEEVLASIRRLVAREVSDAKEREAQERPARDTMPMLSSRASQAARLVLGSDEATADNGATDPEAGGVGEAGTGAGSAEAAQPHAPSPASSHGAGRGTGAAETAADAAQQAVSEEALRGVIRDILQDELHGALAQQIEPVIRRIVQDELAQLFAGTPE